MYDDPREVRIWPGQDAPLMTCPVLAVTIYRLHEVLGVQWEQLEEARRNGRLLAPIPGLDVWSIDEVRDWLRHGAPPCDDWEAIKKAQRRPAPPDRSSEEGGQHGT